MDYEKLGLKCGLEIHQQLETGKLFSRTPSKLRDDKPDYTIKRKLRPVMSELGEYDRAALEAFRKNLEFIYEGYNDTISLIELDEEPPQEMDQEALKTILEVSMLCESNILDQIYVMRKMVIDGSNTSGFQRTALVATGGKIKLKNKDLGIETIVIEEDAARPIEKNENQITYRLDRLGIPLIELATEPGIKTPEEAKEAAGKIGETMRITGKVKRGLGTIRQDLNVSIKEGTRVEIKGVQELAIIDEYVKREVQRQLSLVEIKKELEKRNAEKQKCGQKDLTKIFEKSNSQIIKKAIEKKEKILGIKLENFSGMIGKELQKGRRLGTEFANYVKVKAKLKGIFHSDELPNYGIEEKEIGEVKKELECKNDDAFVLVAGNKSKAELALTVVEERANQCLLGVPEETRGAIGEGNTEYLRPLPGAARMYPETDLAPIKIEYKILEKIKSKLPKSAEERKALYLKWGLNEKLANEMKTNNYARLFEEKVEKGQDAKKLAVFLLEGITEARRKGALIENLNEEDISEFADLINEGKILKETQNSLLLEKTKTPEKKVSELVGDDAVDPEEIGKVVKEIIEENIELVEKMGDRAVGPLMGDAMKKLKGKATGKEISSALKKALQKLNN